MKYFIRLFLILSSVLLLVSCESTEQPASNEPVAEVNKEVAQPQVENEEYTKAVSKLSGETVTISEYEADLAAIQAVMGELDSIMTKKDYQKWMSYVDPDSITYWKNPAHLAKVSTQLPRKDVKVKNLMDYFNYIFIPSRVNHKVEHIRYINSTSVKAVQVKEDESEVVYYNFVKRKAKWMVQLPTLE